MGTNNARRRHEIQSRVATAKAAFHRNNTTFPRKFDLN
jgi:hypothetical protein